MILKAFQNTLSVAFSGVKWQNIPYFWRNGKGQIEEVCREC